MDVADLRKRLDECLDQKQAVYAVVAIIGSTEHGSCDPLGDIVALREEVRVQPFASVTSQSFKFHCSIARRASALCCMQMRHGGPILRPPLLPSHPGARAPLLYQTFV